MSEAIYKKLARHLDELPGGYPETDNGGESEGISLLRNASKF